MTDQIDSTSEATSEAEKPKRRPIHWWIVTYALLGGSIAAGYMLGAVITGIFVGAAISGLYGMLMAPRAAKPNNAKIQLLLALGLPTFLSSLFIPKSKNFIVYLLHLVFLAVPVLPMIIMAIFTALPMSKTQIQKHEDEMALLDADPSIVKQQIKDFQTDFKAKTLMRFNSEDLHKDGIPGIKNDPLASWGLKLMLSTPYYLQGNKNAYPTTLQAADILDYPIHHMFLSATAMGTHSTLKSEQLAKAMPKPENEMTPEDWRSIDLPEVASISALTCVQDRKTKELLRYGALGVTTFTKAENYPIFDPLRDLCEDLISGGMEGLPSDFTKWREQNQATDVAE